MMKKREANEQRHEVVVVRRKGFEKTNSTRWPPPRVCRCVSVCLRMWKKARNTILPFVTKKKKHPKEEEKEENKRRRKENR